MNKKNKQKNIKFFDKEEKELSESVERGEWKSVSKKEKEKMILEFQKVAKNTFGKSKSISLRLNENDLLKLKARALEEGLPYQTLLASIIHKFVSGKKYN